MIDWSRIDALRREIGEAEFRTVAGLFMAEVEEVLARLRTAPDPARCREDFHFLKGSALNLGFAGFAAGCDAREKAAASGAAGIDLAPLFLAYERSKAEFLRAVPAAA